MARRMHHVLSNGKVPMVLFMLRFWWIVMFALMALAGCSRPSNGAEGARVRFRPWRCCTAIWEIRATTTSSRRTWRAGVLLASIDTETGTVARMQREAQDAAVMLNWVNAESGDPASAYAGMIATGPWGVIGHSMRGGRALQVAAINAELRHLSDPSGEVRAGGGDHGRGNADLDLAVKMLRAKYLAGAGQPQEAERLCREIVELARRTSGTETSFFLTTLLNLAQALTLQGKYAEAEPVRREIVGGWQRIGGEAHPNVVSATRDLAENLKNQGKEGEAKALLDQARAIE